MQDAHDSIHITLFLFCLLYFQKFFVQKFKKKITQPCDKTECFFFQKTENMNAMVALYISLQL